LIAELDLCKSSGRAKGYSGGAEGYSGGAKGYSRRATLNNYKAPPFCPKPIGEKIYNTNKSKVYTYVTKPAKIHRPYGHILKWLF